jgi:DNA repair exonuclease SbcCD ATPase subunit
VTEDELDKQLDEKVREITSELEAIGERLATIEDQMAKGGDLTEAKRSLKKLTTRLALVEGKLAKKAAREYFKELEGKVDQIDKRLNRIGLIMITKKDLNRFDYQFARLCKSIDRDLVVAQRRLSRLERHLGLPD